MLEVLERDERGWYAVNWGDEGPSRGEVGRLYLALPPEQVATLDEWARTDNRRLVAGLAKLPSLHPAIGKKKAR